MKRSVLMATTTLLGIAALAVHPSALAYDQYSQDKDATNCRACHGDFRASPYTSRVDGQSWGDDLHDVHRNTMLGGDCDACHSAGGRFPVLLDSSAGTNGLAISCTGCHGRLQDATTGTLGAAAGLRQYHYRAGETVCVNCHADSNPANKIPVGENVLPSYYANPGSNHPAMPTDPCNPAPSYPENFKGTTIGLDNDGDGAWDQADSNCAPQTVCGNGRVEAGEQCDDGNTVNGDCCSSTCRFEGQGSVCDDGLFCNTGEACNGAGACAGGAPTNCSDGIDCTTDSCNESIDQCVHAANNAACDDGLFCSGTETCDPASGCRAGSAVDCTDSDVCTDDACNDTADRCDHVFDPTNDPTCAALVCGNGALDPGEQCDDGNTVNGDCCSSTCRFESQGSACDDGLFCNAGEVCNGAGACAGGAPTNCSDGIDCTTDSCNESIDQCVHAANNAACDDGLFCSGTETCDPASGCRAGSAVDCTDSDICTDDACNDTADRCDHVYDRTNDPSCEAACPDDDGDGYSSVGGECGPADCDDTDAAVRPGATEICTDGKDNDCDGSLDAADTACGGVPVWSVRPGPRVDAAYAGSVACATCHAPQFDAWGGSLHARMMSAPGDAQAAAFPLPDDDSVPGVTIDVASWSDVLFVLGQKWRSVWVSRSGGVQGAQWNYELGRWSSHPEGSYDCGGCHTTGYDPAVAFELDGEIVPGIVGAWVEYNVGCEACHGPGAEHAAAPRRDNINRIELDWTATGEGFVTPSIRSAQVCGHCHFRNEHASGPDSRRLSRSQYNDWSAGPHAASLEPTTLSTYCAKCHSPGNATADSEEHFFSYFDPRDATQVACVSCHDPHATSHALWTTLVWPQDGRRDPASAPAMVARYRGTDGDPTTNDHVAVPSEDSDSLCTGCHTMQPGYRRHVDASPPAVVSLFPPFNYDEPFIVPHGEHVEENGVACAICHMPAARTSMNSGDVRSHTGLPNDVGVDGYTHFNLTCGQCHDQAQDCVWCHGEFARRSTHAPVTPRSRPPRERPRAISRSVGGPAR